MRNSEWGTVHYNKAIVYINVSYPTCISLRRAPREGLSGSIVELFQHTVTNYNSYTVNTADPRGCVPMPWAQQIQFVLLIASFWILDVHFVCSKLSWMRNKEDVQCRAECIDFSLHMIHAAFRSYLSYTAYRIETQDRFWNYVVAERGNPVM